MSPVLTANTAVTTHYTLLF